MFDPELADARIGMSEREAIGRIGMGEIGGIEVHAEFLVPRPVDPGLEMARLELISIDPLAGDLGVAGVQIEAVLARDLSQGQFEVGAQFRGCAGLARIIAGDCQAAAERIRHVFKATDVVTLPAME